MSRQKPANFHATDASGRRWSIRVGPLGIEAVCSRARPYRYGADRQHMGQAGHQRHAVTWRDLLPRDDEASE